MVTPILFMCQSLVNENTLSTELWKLPPSPWSWFSVWVLGNPSFMAISKSVQPSFSCFLFLLEIFAESLPHATVSGYGDIVWTIMWDHLLSIWPEFLHSTVPTSSFRLDFATLSQRYITCSNSTHQGIFFPLFFISYPGFGTQCKIYIA